VERDDERELQAGEQDGIEFHALGVLLFPSTALARDCMHFTPPGTGLQLQHRFASVHVNSLPASSKWSPRLRNGAVGVALAVALYALFGFLVLPLLVKPKLEAQLTQQLGRRATLGRLEFNPFTLRARLLDFALTDRDPARPFARFARLELDVSAASLRYMAPVFDEVRLVAPRIDLVRNVDETYSIDDLIARGPPQQPEEPTPAFSLNNIVVEDGTVSLDDRPHGRMLVVSKIGIGIPFLSSIAHDAKIRVTPRLEGLFDRARLALAGNSTSPFADTQEATLDIDLDALPLAQYAAYAALPGGLKITDGALTTRLKLAFTTDKHVARSVSLSGSVRVDKPALARKDGTPLAGAGAIDVALAKLDWLQRSVALDRVVVSAPQADVRRAADGTLEIAALSGAGAPRQSPPSGRPWTFSVADLRIADGIARIADASVSPTFEIVLSGIGIEGKRIASAGAPGSIGVRFAADDGAQVEMQGELDLRAGAARGHFACRQFHLARLHPYYAPALNVEIRRATVDLAGDFDTRGNGAATAFTLKQGTVHLADVEAAIAGERNPLWRFASADVDGVALDLAARQVAIERVTMAQASIDVVREANGHVNVERLVRTAATHAQRDGSASARSTSGGGWNVLVRKLEGERIAAAIEDRSALPPVKLRLSDARLRLANIGTARGEKSPIELAARIGSKGRLRLEGTLAQQPLAADWRVEATNVDLVPLRPYFEPRTNIVVTSGSANAKGRLKFAARSGAPSVAYQGNVVVNGFGSLDRPSSQELLRWQSLTLTGVDATSDPFRLAVASIGMDRFYARVILNDDATLNLTRLLAPEAAATQAEASGPSKTVAGVTTRELSPQAERADLPVSIGRIEVSNGELQYSDFFVRPNYTAHLTDVAGSVSSLSASQAGAVELSARVEGTAPVDVRGTLNPFARDLQLDLTGKATDVDLPPLTPYSVKYAGYGIQKGKLSFEVHYRVDDRKLAATNKLKLDQLTFGERVASPTATRLPVLLAVSLLKDRNGVINLDLPIRGTLDDPQFSVWGILVQIFVNLVTKAVTAPFALLASIGGGGGEQLAYVEFAPGRADLEAAAEAKLETLSKALADRPGIRIEAAGRAVPEIDRDGLKRASLDRALRTEKQKALAAAGESAPALDAVTIGSDEYPKLLATVYSDAKIPDKPRNVLGIAKSIPPAEMEALLLASYRVDDEALATLANRRAQAVKEWFVRKGNLPSERVFVVAPKLAATGIADQGAATRVDFAIR
jgi:uncharacterized protein involved in outer membrane biogenesis